jgi:hypothetical protein
VSVFWVDSDVLIWSKDNAYRFDAPHSEAFWNTIKAAIQNETIKMTKRNYEELTEGRKGKKKPDDQLMKWLTLHYCPSICVPTTKEVTAFAKKIGEYCYSNPRFLLRWNIEFSNGADPWLIAHAAVSGGTVVTREAGVTGEAKRPKIPNLCKLYKVDCISMYDMLDRLAAK